MSVCLVAGWLGHRHRHILEATCPEKSGMKALCAGSCGAALEVEGTKSNGSGSTGVSVLDGGGGMRGGGNAQWAVRETFPTSRYQLAGACQRWQDVQEVTDETVWKATRGREEEEALRLDPEGGNGDAGDRNRVGRGGSRPRGL